MTVRLRIAQNPLHTFPRNFPVDGEAANLLRTCWGLVSDTANKSATSRCNGIWEKTRHNRHNGLCPRQLVKDLLRTCYGKTGVMNFGLNPFLHRLQMTRLQHRHPRLNVHNSVGRAGGRTPAPPGRGGPHACSGASCYVGEPFWAHQNAKNLSVAGAPPRTPLGELTALPQTL